MNPSLIRALDGAKRPLSALAVLAVAASCSGSSGVDGPKSGGDVPGVVASGTPQTLDTSPAPMPKSLVSLTRINSVAKSLDTFEKLVALPVSLRALIDEESKGALKFIELGGSFDVAVALDPATRDLDDPKLFYGFSIPVKDVEGLAQHIQREGDEVRSVGAGAYRIRNEKGDLLCDLVPTGGDAPGRLVCSENTAGLRELGPWMVRTLPLEPKGKEDVVTRLDFAPFQALGMPVARSKADEAVGEIRRELDGAGVRDSELLEAPTVFFRESLGFLDELDRAEMKLTVDGQKPELRLFGELRFKGAASWPTQVLTAKNGQKSPPPDLFWRLPKDSDSALFGRSADPAMFTGIRRVLRKGAGHALTFAPLKDPDKQAILALIDAIPNVGGTWASANGSLSKLPGGAGTGPFTPAQAVSEAKSLARTIAGWSVTSVEGDPAQMTAFLKQAVDVYDRGVRFAKQEADDDLKSASKEMKEFYRAQRSDMDKLPKARFSTNVAGFPKGSAALDLDIAFTSKDVWSLTNPEKDWDKKGEHPKGPESKGSVTLRILVVPDEPGRYVWGYSVDGEALKQRVLGSLKAAKPEATLASRTDLARLKSPAVGGGFVSYGKLVESFANLDKNDSDMKEALELLAKMPNRGAAPVFVLLNGDGPPKPSVSFELVLEKPWMDDMAALFRAGFAEAMKKDKAVATPPPPPAPTPKRK